MELTSRFRTLYDSKGLEFNDVRSTPLRYDSDAEKTKVVLYNFFENSTATLSQWRLVLNDVEQKDHSYEAPVFDETRHAGICSEASHVVSRPVKFLITTPEFTVEIPICCNHSSKGKSLDNG